MSKLKLLVISGLVFLIITAITVVLVYIGLSGDDTTSVEVVNDFSGQTTTIEIKQYSFERFLADLKSWTTDTTCAEFEDPDYVDNRIDSKYPDLTKLEDAGWDIWGDAFILTDSEDQNRYTVLFDRLSKVFKDVPQPVALEAELESLSELVTNKTNTCANDNQIIDTGDSLP